MQSHQRYFPLGGQPVRLRRQRRRPRDRALRGNTRVLEGRLERRVVHVRARQRRRDRGAGGAARLDHVRSRGAGIVRRQDASGSVALVEELGGDDAAREAARLAKADQAAELVREFPELEGYIGAEYARLAGMDEAVCRAIEEQYLPDGADAPLPRTEAGRVLAAADKLDT